jgi:DNA-binding CsgD family transcriptional regulator
MAQGAADSAISTAYADLLERSDELAALKVSLDGVLASGRGQVVLLAGEAGVGKTALLERFCDQTRRTTRVVTGACDPLFTPRPLGPLFVATDVGLEQLVGTGATPHEVVVALGRELVSHGPSVFVLEDLHWADEATLDVLLLLVRRVHSLPVLVLASYRDDAIDNVPPLRRVLGELATSSSVRRLKIWPLSPEAVAELAEPHDVDPAELYGKTAGNPFFVVEALATGERDVPATVRDAVLARAAPLTPAGRQVLEAVAVVPQRVELWLLNTVVGETIEALDECVRCGMLVADASGISFRHELARLAIDGSLGVGGKRKLHRKVLTALSSSPGAQLNQARLAHHAEAAGDAEAVLRYALPAAERAASMGAHREAAAQYARALRSGDSLTLQKRAELLERRSHECYLADQTEEALAAIKEALACRQQLGDKLCEGDLLRWLSEVLWCPGYTSECVSAARQAVALLEQLPPGPELARAYGQLGDCCSAAEQIDESVFWSKRSYELAERLGERETSLKARAKIAVCTFNEGGLADAERACAEAQEAGFAELAGEVFLWTAGTALDAQRYDVAAHYIDTGFEYCSDRGLELFRLYILAFRARLELDQGRWTAAAQSAEAVLRVPRASITPRIRALVVLALVRARRGDPGHSELLEEAWALAEPTGTLWRLGPVAAARAEVAWLAGDSNGAGSAAEQAFDLALECNSGFVIAELGAWRRRAGLVDAPSPGAAGAHAWLLTGQWEQAREAWLELGCPYEAALALVGCGQEGLLKRALEELQSLEARPAAAIVSRQLRQLGTLSLPRGPRPATRQNQFGLTRRELDVLALVNDGMQNREIADQLVVSVRTVDHHVEAIIRKLGVRSRAQTRPAAEILGLSRSNS